MDLSLKIGKMTFKNPIWVASGTFGNAEEFEDFLDLGKIGAIITKTITLNERVGNPSPRVIETASGLLNSIGLENKGVEKFKQENLPFLKRQKTNVIISIAGSNIEEYEECLGKLLEGYSPSAVEVNLSCPNVSHKGAKHRLFSQDEGTTKEMVTRLKKITRIPLIVKLTPNVTDIAEIAKAAEEGGADALALVNTYLGMAVDAEALKPRLGRVVGGLSGPAIKPLALRAVWDVYNSVKIPIIGMGGIMTGTDVAEFMLCGAAAVELGTVNFVDPTAYTRISEEFDAYCEKKNISSVKEISGKLKVP